MHESESHNHVSRKKKQLRFFNRVTRKSAAAIDARFSDELGHSFMADVKEQYEMLLPCIPDVGGIEPWTRQLALTALFLAVYKTMTALGRTVEESWEVCSEIIEAQLLSIPRFMRKIIRNSVFTNRQRATYRKQALQSQERRYAKGDVFQVIEGDGNAFDYGLDITECAKVQFLKEQDALEFMPYVCLVDKLWAEIFGYGLVRKGTLADGFDRCDFRLKKNGPTQVHSPVWKEEWSR